MTSLVGSPSHRSPAKPAEAPPRAEAPTTAPTGPPAAKPKSPPTPPSGCGPRSTGVTAARKRATRIDDRVLERHQATRRTSGIELRSPCNYRNSDRLAAPVVAHGELTSARLGVSAACRRVAGTGSAAAIVTGWSRPYVSCVRPVGTSPTGEPAPDAAESHPAWVRAGDPPVPPG